LFQSDTTTKVLCICLLLSFISLVGLPPLGGFIGKLMIFSAAFNAGYIHWMMWVFVAIAGLNTVFSLFYYLRVIKAMFIEAPADGQKPIAMPGTIGAFVLVISLPILILGIVPGWLSQLAAIVAIRFNGG